MTDNHQTESASTKEAKSARGSRNSSLIGGIVLGGSLALMGGFFVYALLALGYSKAVESDKWIETPCTVLKSNVLTERATPNSPGLSHELEIAYRYDFEDATFESDRYRRIASRSAHKSKIEAIVRQFPANSKSVCYVNPKDPKEAILKKDTRAVGYTIWFPGLFVVGGIGIVIASIRRAMQKQ